MIIYKITHKDNGLSYIGQTTQTLKRRWLHHLRQSRYRAENHFHLALRKYPKDVWNIEILEELNDIDYLNEREIYWISYYNTFYNGYNSTTGGSAGKMSEDVKKKISKIHKGKKISDEQKLIASITHSGSNNYWYGTKGYNFGKKGKEHPSFGVKHTDEWKNNKSDMMKGENNPMHGTSFRWINNGFKNKRYSRNEETPVGWLNGYVFKPKKQPTDSVECINGDLGGGS